MRTLLLRGALFGSVLPLILLLSCALLWFSESRLRQRAELQPLADEHDLLEVKIQKEKKVLEAAVQTNQAMARAMAMSAPVQLCLAELQRLVPQTIVWIRRRSVAMLWSSVVKPSCLMVAHAQCADAVAGAIGVV